MTFMQRICSYSSLPIASGRVDLLRLVQALVESVCLQGAAEVHQQNVSPSCTAPQQQLPHQHPAVTSWGDAHHAAAQAHMQQMVHELKVKQQQHASACSAVGGNSSPLRLSRASGYADQGSLRTLQQWQVLSSSHQQQQQQQHFQQDRGLHMASTAQHGTMLLHQQPHHNHQQQQQQQYQQRRSLHLAPPFLVEDYVPAAVTSYRLGRMPGKLKAAQAELADCRACPRNCGVNRLKDELGVCNVGRKMLVSTVAPHFAEEAALQGWAGSGTVFFSGCNMRCVFCQNWDISQKRAGFELAGPELADWMMKLQELGGCHNINFVTPEHVAPQVVEAIAAAVEKGLAIPIIYNTSSYDALSSLALMEGLIDIYMPDFKFWSAASAQRYAKAKDYPDRAKEAIKEMHRQVGDLVFSPDGLAKRGLLLRHLVMPGLLDEGKAILDWAAQELGRDTFVNIMEQYSPRYLVGQGEQRSRGWTKYEEIDRRPGSEEVEELKQYGRSIGLWRFEEVPRYKSTELAG